ncbi:hypothetical protein JCM17380_37440 [Desulfosporosinus burensis]
MGCALKAFEVRLRGHISSHRDGKNQSMVEQLQGRLHRGEVEVIVGAKELAMSTVVIDDLHATLLKHYSLQQSVLLESY